jgi:hypothetical protein
MLKEIDADLEIHCLDCVQDRLDLLHRHILAGIWFVDGHPVDDQTFDVVVAGEFLEHLYPADVDKKVCDADAESTLSKACTEEW